METLHRVFIPALGQTGPRAFTLHEWVMDGMVVKDVPSVRRFPISEVRHFAGATFFVPPPELMAAVRDIEAAGGRVEGPEGWREVLELPATKVALSS